MKIDARVYPHFYEPICESEETFTLRQDILNIHKNGRATFRHIENQMRLAGLDRLVLFAQDERSVDSRVCVSNEEVFRLTQMRPDLFIGIASVDPTQAHAAEELEKALGQYNLKGVALNLAKLNIHPDDSCLEPIIRMCIRYNRPICFDAGISFARGFKSELGRPYHYENLAIKYPELRFSLTRVGWPWVEETAMLLMKYPNVYADLGVMYFGTAQEFMRYLLEHALQKGWVERSLRHQLMFASENPRFEQIRMAQALDNYFSSDKTERLIMGENALVFMGEKI